MRLIISILLMSVAQFAACDLTGGVSNVQRHTEQELKQFFPKARVIVSPERGIVTAITCTRGLGKAAIDEIGSTLSSKAGIQRLEHARQLPVKVSPYRLFLLQFDEYFIRFDVDAKQHSVVRTDSRMRQQYERLCGDLQVRH